MADDTKPVGIPEGKAVPLGPGAPEDSGPGLSALGSTFAERKAAREAAEAKASGKQVDEDSAGVEDKAVSRKRTSRK